MATTSVVMCVVCLASTMQQHRSINQRHGRAWWFWRCTAPALLSKSTLSVGGTGRDGGGDDGKCYGWCWWVLLATRMQVMSVCFQGILKTSIEPATRLSYCTALTSVASRSKVPITLDQYPCRCLAGLCCTRWEIVYLLLQQVFYISLRKGL